MSEYMSTREGFQRSMKWSLTGPSEVASLDAEATTTPTFYHIFNGRRIARDAYIKGIAEWRDKSSEYEPIVRVCLFSSFFIRVQSSKYKLTSLCSFISDEFLRDDDQLAARITGTIKVDGITTAFESFMFAKIDKETGKIE